MYAVDLLKNPNLDIDPITANIGSAALGDKIPKSEELAHFGVGSDDIKKLVLKLQKYKTNGRAEYADVRSVVREAWIEDSIDKTPTFTITVYDPDWQLLVSGALDGAVDINPGSIPRRWYRLDGFDLNDDEITMTFATRNAVFLSMHKRPVKFSRNKMTRAEAIQALTRRVKIVKIPMYCPQLHKKQPQAKFKGSSEKEKSDSRSTGFTPSDKITVKARSATPSQRKVVSDVIEAGVDSKMPGLVIVMGVMCVIQESTASNNPQPPNPPYVGAFQQNRAMGWPGTGDAYRDAKDGFYPAALKVYKANPDRTLGWLVAKVQGVLGSDNPLNNGYAQETDRWRGEAQHAVNAYGGIDVEDPGSAMTTSEAYRKSYEFMVGEPDGPDNENYLGAIYRLAKEVNWRAYWVRDTLHYMSEEDLFKAKARIRLKRYANGVEGVQMNWDRSKKVSQIILKVRMDRWVAPVGTVVIWDEGSSRTGKGRWLVTNIRRSVFDTLGEITLRKPIPEKLEPAPESGSRTESEAPGVGGEFAAYTDLVEAASVDGAKGIVDSLVSLSQSSGGDTVVVVSDYRPNSVTSSGNPSDHAANDSVRAARDIAKQGVNALVGPPSVELDRAVEAIGRAIGKPYKGGQTIIDDTTKQLGDKWYRIQVIWRTPAYGGHMGHIHVGCKVVPSPRMGGRF